MLALFVLWLSSVQLPVIVQHECEIITCAKPDERAETERLEHDVLEELNNLVSTTDAKSLSDKLDKLETLQKAYPPELNWKKATTASVKKDIKALLALNEEAQRKTLETISDVRYAVADYRTGKPQESVKAIENAMRQYERTLGAESYLYVLALDLEVGAMIGMNRSSEATVLADRLLKLRVKTFGKDHITTANAFQLSGDAAIAKQNWTMAGKMYKDAVEIREKILGKSDKTNMHSEKGLIRSQIELNDRDAAREGLVAFHQARKLTLEKEAFARADYYFLVARLEEKCEHLDKAQIALEKALSSGLEFLPRNHPQVLATATQLRSLLVRQEKWDDVRMIEQEWRLPPASPTKVK